MSGIWSWAGAAWTTDHHTNESFWEEDTDQYVPLESNLQRVIVRDGNYVYSAQDQIPTFFGLKGGLYTVTVLVGTDELGLSPVETQHVPIVWSTVNVDTLNQDTHATAHGYVPNINMDLAVKRTNGVDRNGQTHIQVRRIFHAADFEPGPNVPSFYGSGELLYLAHKP